MRRRLGVRRIVAWDDKRRDLHCAQLFRLGSGRSVAVEERAGAERDADRAAHAAAEHEGGVVAEMVQQCLALVGVERPAEGLDSTAGAAGLAPVIRDALVLLAERPEGVHLRPYARRRPLLDR